MCQSTSRRPQSLSLIPTSHQSLIRQVTARSLLGQTSYNSKVGNVNPHPYTGFLYSRNRATATRDPLLSIMPQLCNIVGASISRGIDIDVDPHLLKVNKHSIGGGKIEVGQPLYTRIQATIDFAPEGSILVLQGGGNECSEPSTRKVKENRTGRLLRALILLLEAAFLKKLKVLFLLPFARFDRAGTIEIKRINRTLIKTLKAAYRNQPLFLLDPLQLDDITVKESIVKGLADLGPDKVHPKREVMVNINRVITGKVKAWLQESQDVHQHAPAPPPAPAAVPPAPKGLTIPPCPPLWPAPSSPRRFSSPAHKWAPSRAHTGPYPQSRPRPAVPQPGVPHHQGYVPRRPALLPTPSSVPPPTSTCSQQHLQSPAC